MSSLKTKRIFHPVVDESSKRLVSDFVGNTPFVQLSDKIYAKLESVNPGGSIKDRPVKWILDDAEERGLLKYGDTIIEATSGNTGIALAMVAAAKGYRLILTMPDSMSIERRSMLRAYGAELQLTPGNEGISGAIQLAKELVEEMPDAYLLQQFDNHANPKVHELTTAEEIWVDCDGDIDCLICGVGTGT